MAPTIVTIVQLYGTVSAFLKIIKLMSVIAFFLCGLNEFIKWRSASTSKMCVVLSFEAIAGRVYYDL